MKKNKKQWIYSGLTLAKINETKELRGKIYVKSGIGRMIVYQDGRVTLNLYDWRHGGTIQRNKNGLM